MHRATLWMQRALERFLKKRHETTVLMRGQSKRAWAWTRQSATRPFTEVAFHASRTHFVWRKQFLHRLPFKKSSHVAHVTKYCSCHRKGYCACHKKWQLYSTRLDATMVYPTLLYFALLYSALPLLLYAASTLLFATLLCSSLLCSTPYFKSPYIGSFFIKFPLIVFYSFYDIIFAYIMCAIASLKPSLNLKPPVFDRSSPTCRKKKMSLSW